MYVLAPPPANMELGNLPELGHPSTGDGKESQ